MINELITSGANVQFVVNALDLKEFAQNVIEEYKASELITQKPDKVIYAKEAAERLGKSLNTLWKWGKKGYLKPAGHIGQTPYYLESQITDFLKCKSYVL